jgi:hypothetical protein
VAEVKLTNYLLKVGSGGGLNPGPASSLGDKITLVIDDTRFVLNTSVFTAHPDTMLGTVCRYQIPDNISDILEKLFFGLKYINSLMRIPDPGWKKFRFGIRDKRPGSAALANTAIYSNFLQVRIK